MTNKQRKKEIQTIRQPPRSQRCKYQRAPWHHIRATRSQRRRQNHTYPHNQLHHCARQRRSPAKRQTSDSERHSQHRLPTRRTWIIQKNESRRASSIPLSTERSIQNRSSKTPKILVRKIRNRILVGQKSRRTLKRHGTKSPIHNHRATRAQTPHLRRTFQWIRPRQRRTPQKRNPRTKTKRSHRNILNPQHGLRRTPLRKHRPHPPITSSPIRQHQRHPPTIQHQQIHRHTQKLHPTLKLQLPMR